MAKYLQAGGLLFAGVAAVPGILDYFGIVPPESSAKKRATKHALLMISMLFVFTVALLLRRNSQISFYLVFAIDLAGVILLCIAGWHGGTLVYRNQIGVDHRYAGAGKWKEETINSEGRIELRNIEKLGVNQMKLLHINNKRIVVGRTESEIVAFDDFCTHRGGSLADGTLICGTVQCPWHGSQFNVRTGAVNAGPAKERIGTYRIEQANQKYYLHLS